MNWTKIRFELDHTGRYADTQIGLDSASIPDAARIADFICSGYTVGSGLKAHIMEIRGHSSGNLADHYYLPKDQVQLFKYLFDLRKKS